MELNKLYSVAEKENIRIYDWHIEHAYGAFINIDNLNAIALNYNEFGTSLDEKQTLAEELRPLFFRCNLSIILYRHYINEKTRV